MKTIRLIALVILLTQNFAFATPKEKKPFESFTGKVLGNKVRLRSSPEYDSKVVRQVNKDDFLLVNGEDGDFFSIEPPKGTKVYAFRSYILDNTVEANRVNIRLEPSVDAPIVGQLKQGDKVEGKVSMVNKKWMEITPPSTVRFYISKDFIKYAGKKDYIVQQNKRKEEANQLLTSTYKLAQEESEKAFEKMNPKPAIERFQKIINQYSDFPSLVKQAKEGLAVLQEAYLNKKLSYLDSKSNEDVKIEEVEFPKVEVKTPPKSKNIWKRANNKSLPAKVQQWDPVEESLFQSWLDYHPNKTQEDYYYEQRINSIALTGIVQAFDTSVKNRPGDFVLRQNGTPRAFLYSTEIDLGQYVGKKLTVYATPRPNNHFAFPAYFVLSVE